MHRSGVRATCPEAGEIAGSLDLLGLRLRVCVFRNEDKSGSQPDFRPVSFGLDEKKDEETEY